MEVSGGRATTVACRTMNAHLSALWAHGGAHLTRPQVPTDLRSYPTLLKALGVRDRFSLLDFVGALQRLQTQSRGSPLDPHNMSLAVGKHVHMARLSLPEYMCPVPYFL